MIRLKSFDATGIAPNGRLFAGDLNALQDAVAALTDLTQNLSVASVSIGESGLQLVRFGAGEARITGAARVDGILRGLSGLYAGQYTTTQRDAIPTGARPTGLIVFNTTNNRPEFNAGSDASPSWQPVGPLASTSGTLSSIPAASSVASGSFYYATDQDVLYRSNGTTWARIGDKAGDIVLTFNTAAATGRVFAQGQNISRTGINADLFAAWATTYGVGDGSTTFGLPDLRGRMPVFLGTHTDVNVLGNNDGQAVANRRPKHRTTNALTLPNHTHSAGAFSPGVNSNGYNSFTADGNAPASTLTIGNPSSLPAIAGSVGTNVGTDNLDAPSYITINGEVKL